MFLKRDFWERERSPQVIEFTTSEQERENDLFIFFIFLCACQGFSFRVSFKKNILSILEPEKKK